MDVLLDILSPFTGILLSQIFPVMAIFVRLSVFLFLVPTIGETTISVRIRLGLALMLTLLLVPGLVSTFAGDTSSLSSLLTLMAKESMFGLFMGLGFRLMIFILQIGGNMISQALSISQPLGQGISTEPNTTLSSMFMLVGTTLLITLDFHIVAVGIFYESYAVWPLGTGPDLETLAFTLSQQALSIFRISLSLAFPFLLLNFIYNLLLGFVNRAMPQLLVSFVGMPAIIGLGLVVLAASAGGILILWVSHFQDFSRGLLG
jgi:flagellar biosynthetic protein FliR